MKNRLFGIAVSLMALLSSCETIVEQEISVEVLPAAEQVIFTADLGVDTKTYLEYQDGVYKTRWNAGDQIFVMATSSDGSYWYDTANLIEGAGTSTGKFAVATNVTGEKFFAFYGNFDVYPEGSSCPYLYDYQYSPYLTGADSDNIDGFYFPMYAESTNTTFSFKNLCSILKVGLSGTEYIDNIVFTPNDPTMPVAGSADLQFVDGKPEFSIVDSTAKYSITYYVRETLDETQVKEYYISIPPRTYEGGFTLTINSNTGNMEVKVTDDVTFERSEIRSMPQITFENQVVTTWGLVGSMTDWGNDVVMTPVDNYQVIEKYYIDAADEFKFRANGAWDVDFGYAGGDPIQPYTTVELVNGGANMKVSESGYYNIWLDVTGKTAYFEKIVECSSYDEVAALPDNTKVSVWGYVISPYGRGFVMNIGSYWNNCILVYQGTDQSVYMPVMGNSVSFIATKTTYNNLPELKDIQNVEVISDGVRDYGYNGYYNLYDPEDFANFDSARYVYVKYTGTLKKSGGYYNVEVDGVTERMGSIEFPTQDLTEYIDKKVSVEGWFIGFASGGKYLKTVIRSISLVDDEVSNEDVTPGDDIVVTKSAATIE